MSNKTENLDSIVTVYNGTDPVEITLEELLEDINTSGRLIARSTGEDWVDFTSSDWEEGVCFTIYQLTKEDL